MSSGGQVFPQGLGTVLKSQGSLAGELPPGDDNRASPIWSGNPWVKVIPGKVRLVKAEGM